MSFKPKSLRLVASMLVLLALVINHQGCGNSMTPGNGGGYEGLTGGSGNNDGSASTVHTIQLTAYFVYYGICNGSMDRVAVISRAGGQYRLIRSNCMNLDQPLLLNGEQVLVNPSIPNVLIYNGQEYQKESYD